eukprot:TRINITY_DN9570_c0_g1_i1.p1 TRINITY_DN9570_c0_g1~~TRINITY_DN9570_c0_g1_i1.p1  ORF type:complete len:502 (-),score=97.90 TRINITY_DN9570_c0_g1_i1:57-1562(-)
MLSNVCLACLSLSMVVAVSLLGLREFLGDWGLPLQHQEQQRFLWNLGSSQLWSSKELFERRQQEHRQQQQQQQQQLQQPRAEFAAAARPGSSLAAPAASASVVLDANASSGPGGAQALPGFSSTVAPATPNSSWPSDDDLGKCKEMPWDRFTDPPAGEDSVVCIPRISVAGRFGNFLFGYAKAMVTATQKKMPVAFLLEVKYAGILLPCMRNSTRLPAVARCSRKHSVRSQSAHFQSLKDWYGVDNTAQARDMFRKAFYVELPYQHVRDATVAPGARDLVLYYRTFLERDWQKIPRKASFEQKVTATFLGARLINAPPFAFFSFAARRHRAKYGADAKIWILCAPAQRWQDTVQRMVRELGATIMTKNDRLGKIAWLADWLFLKAAKHVAVSPSTYGWWAAFLGEAEDVYLPIHPGKTGFAQPWCMLFPTDDVRFVFYDWWKNKSYSVLEGTGREAYKTCMEYWVNCRPGIDYEHKVLPFCPIVPTLKELEPFFPESLSPT